MSARHDDDSREHASALLAVRVARPVGIAVAGVVVIVAGNAALGAMLVGVAALVALANAFIRLGLSSGDDRAREQLRGVCADNRAVARHAGGAPRHSREDGDEARHDDGAPLRVARGMGRV